MIMWPEAVDLIEAGGPPPKFKTKKIAIHKSFVVITGPSGVGKTHLWSALTGRGATTGPSSAIEHGYMAMTSERSRQFLGLHRHLAMNNVPGRNSSQRFEALDLLFHSQTPVHGVVFVASGGYDHIWPENADIVADKLRNNDQGWKYDIAGLRARNLDQEQESFREICIGIQQKITISRDATARPRWLLVLVNKADLYWGGRGEIEARYLPGSGSEFDNHRADLIATVGNNTVQYLVSPLVTRPSEYRFQPSSPAISAPSHLTDGQRDAALSCLAQNLEELSYG
ncbi:MULTISPECIES: hypothetical protein [unclassified Mycobacterium]|uniref:hypothetical protein n=1 Tax=unclassified Mycobacterium TaxID=2642494 RepID=UPI0029C7F772|nr:MULTISPECIES: hypothetical protein [unclassified Mycobacterium]